MNAGLIILRVSSERRDAQNERDGAHAAQLRRSSDSVAGSQQLLRRSITTTYTYSTQLELVVSSSRPSSAAP